MKNEEILEAVLLSMQRALLGMIYPSIRAIAVGFEGVKKIKVIYYLDREPNNDDYENISDVVAEVCSDLNFTEVEEVCFFQMSLFQNLIILTLGYL